MFRLSDSNPAGLYALTRSSSEAYRALHLPTDSDGPYFSIWGEGSRAGEEDDVEILLLGGEDHGPMLDARRVYDPNALNPVRNRATKRQSAYYFNDGADMLAQTHS